MRKLLFLGIAILSAWSSPLYSRAVSQSSAPSATITEVGNVANSSQTSSTEGNVQEIDLGQEAVTELKEVDIENSDSGNTQNSNPIGSEVFSSIEKGFFKRLKAKNVRLKQFGYRFFVGKPKLVLSVPVDRSYLLGPGDELFLYVVGNPPGLNLSKITKLVVDREGKVYIPGIGIFYVWGMSLGEAEEVISRSLGTNIKLTVGRLRTFPVYVSGEVRRPGAVVVTGVNTVIDAIMMAGGIQKSGTLRDVLITRKTPDGLKRIHIDFYQLLLEGKPIDIKLKDGDVIFVGPIGKVAGIAGKVKRPAIYELKGKETLRDLISMAGGLLPSSYKYKVIIQRYRDNNLTEIVEGSLDDKRFISQEVHDGDLVVIKPVISIPQNAVMVDGYTSYPGLYEYKEGMKLSELLKPDLFFIDSNMKFAYIERRYPPGSAPKYITFVPENVLSGKEDLELKPADRIVLFKFGNPKKINFNKIKDAFIVQGEIKYPGVYAYKKGMKLSDVLTPEILKVDTNLKFGLIERIKYPGAHPEYITFIPEDVLRGESDIELKPLDKITFFRLGDTKSIDFNKVKNAFVVEGEIKYSGVYAYKKGMKLSQILNPEMITMNTNLYYAEIDRRDPETLDIVEIKNFAPMDILQGKKDIEIHRLDIIKFYPKYVYPPVKVSGLVEKSYYLPYHEGLKLSEALSSAKFIKDIKKLKVEVFREVPKTRSIGAVEKAESIRVKAETGGEVIKKNIASIFLYDLLIKKDSKVDITLNPGDRLVVKEVEPEEMVEKVTVLGYVKNPGVFKIDEKTTLYDVLKAAGGFRENAYPQGIIILRRSVKEMQRERVVKAITLMKQELEKEEAGVMQSDLSEEELRARQKAFEAKRRLLEEIEKAQVTGRISGIVVPYDLEKLRNSPYNILLEDGDRIYVPKKPGSVLVFGEVYNPSAFVYVKGMTVRDYLDMAGGLTKDADKENIFVIKADGSVVSSSNLNRGKDWDGRNYPEWGRPPEYATNILDYELKPGDAIIVPTEIHVPTMWRPLIRDVMQIIYQGAITIYTVTKL